MSKLNFLAVEKTSTELLDKLSPFKKKNHIANYQKTVAKVLSKAIMLRAKLRNRFLKTRMKSRMKSRMKYNKKNRNMCVTISRKAKIIYCENLYLED